MKRSPVIAIRLVPIVSVAIALLLTIAVIESSSIRRVLGYARVYPIKGIAADVSVELSDEQRNVDRDGRPVVQRTVKFSFPFSLARGGCEFTYGAAVYEFPSDAVRKTYYELKTPRYLIKFKYDFKHERCENKDLAVDVRDLPERIRLQLVDVAVEEERVIETPRADGVELRFAGNSVPSISPVTITSQHPFLPARTTTRLPKLSTTATYSVFEPPFDDLKKVILDEFRKRTKRCEESRVCDEILIAVSRVDDPEIIEAIDAGRKAGLSIELISSPHPRKRGELSSTGRPYLEADSKPWMWLRGNSPLETDRAILPMHAKFAVFGDDVVVSSNTNYSFDWFYRTREFALRYEGREIASIFKEIFAMIRTSVLYPVSVDLNDPVIILLNAERPLGYAASSRNPYVEIRTNEGFPSSAYGILFNLMDRTPGRLDLIMAPLVDSCATYRIERCFYNLLARKAAENMLHLRINSYFYLLPDLKAPARPYFWNRVAIRDHLRFFPTLDEMRSRVAPDGAPLRVMLHPQEGTSSFHQRLSLIGEEFVVGGSANFAKTETLNTIEILRDPALNARLRREFSAFDDPYFVTERVPPATDRPHFGRCEFVLERDVLHPEIRGDREFRSADILAALSARHPSFQGRFEIVTPTNLEEMFESEDAFEKPQFNFQRLEGAVRSASSSFCVRKDGGDDARAVRLK